MASFVSFKDRVPSTRKQAEEVKGHRQRMNPDPVMQQMGPFSATFAAQNIANATPAPQNWSPALNQGQAIAVLGCSWSVHAQLGTLRRCSGQTGKDGENGAPCRRRIKEPSAQFCILDVSGCQFQQTRCICIPRYTQACFQTLPTEQCLQLCYSVITSSGVLFELLYQMQCFKHTSYYEVASLPFQSS